MAIIKCSNCGASFDEKEPKCPYCGMINVSGAEKEYKSKLERIRTRLDNVDEEAENSVREEVRAFFKTFLFVLCFVLALIVIVIISRGATKKASIQINRMEAVKNLSELKEYHSYEKEWNRLYDEGDYETMCSLYAEQSGNVRNFRGNWIHYRFYDQYNNYKTFESYCESYRGNPGYSSYYASVLSYLMSFHYALYDRSYEIFSSDEMTVLEGIWTEMKAEALSTLDLSEAELDKFIEDNSGSYPSYNNCSDFAKERVDK